MQVMMRSVLYASVIGAAGVVSACGPRKVDVRTSPTTVSQLTVEVHNTLPQAVNVYVIQNGVKTFLRQVNANATVSVPVQGVVPGATVRLEATTIDGVRTYSRDNVTLNGNFVFPLP